MFTSRHLLLFSVLALSVIFESCAPSADTEDTDEQVRGSFYVRYLAEANELKGQASFYGADSTALQLANGVAFVSSGTRERKLPGDIIRYETTMNVPYPEELRFNFQLPNKEASTEVKYNLTGIPNYEIVEASKESGLILELNGTLAEGETLLLLFTDPNQEARTILRPGPLSREQLLIPADALTLFTPGEYRLYLVKQVEVKAKVAGLSYDFSAEYYSPEAVFTLEE